MLNFLAPGLRVIVGTVLVAALSSCTSADSTPTTTDTGAKDNKTWRYFDRELYFPTGVSVSPEMSAAQELVRQALKDLEESTDLGKDYFIFLNDEDSILQPVTSETSYQGRNWRSFYQIWDDENLNSLLGSKVGTSSDQDLLVSLNAQNEREFYVISRLGCFVAGESCSYATQGQAKALVWRSMGYLIGLRYGKNASSDIMKSGTFPAQESQEARKKFLAEFDNRLESVRNGLPAPN